MKLKNRILIITIILLVLSAIPTIVNAKVYNISGTDMDISIDDTEWYVFTRSNIENNSELDELGISYEYLDNFMKNNYVYLDAVLYFSGSDDYIEIIIRKTNIDKINNLSNFPDDAVLSLAKEFADMHNATDYKIYDTNYKFTKVNYIDQGLYIYEYCTAVNGYAYTITAQKPYEFTSSDVNRVEGIVDTIKFDVDESLTDEETLKEVKSGNGFNWDEVWEKAFIGGMVGLIGSLLGKLIKKGKRKENDEGEKDE